MNHGRMSEVSLIFKACWALTAIVIALGSVPAHAEEFNFPSTPAAVRNVEPRAQKDIALEAARLLRERYVYEPIGNKYADRLEAAANSAGESMTAEALAKSLTSMLQFIQRDKHLKILDPARARRILAMFGMLENEADDDVQPEPAGGHHATSVKGDGFGRVERV